MSKEYSFEAMEASVEPSGSYNRVQVNVEVEDVNQILDEINSEDLFRYLDREEALSHFEPKPKDLEEDDMVEYLRDQGWIIRQGEN